MTATLSDVRSTPWLPGSGPTVALLLHGYGSNEADLSGLAAAIGLTMPWASLRAPITMGHGGAAWFEIVTPGDPDAEPVRLATEAIWHWVDEHAGPDVRVVPIGFSQGGLMASQLLRTRPDRVAAAVILGGFVRGGDESGDSILAESRPPVFRGRGAEDRVIGVPAISRTADFLPDHTSLEEHVYPGLAHGINDEEVADIRAFLLAHV
jgi:phospholipase/carboxylesterase